MDTENRHADHRHALSQDFRILTSRLHDPALPDMDFRNRANSNFSPNVVSETGSTGFVEVLVRLQAEAAGDDFFLDLGGAAENPYFVKECNIGLMK